MCLIDIISGIIAFGLCAAIVALIIDVLGIPPYVGTVIVILIGIFLVACLFIGGGGDSGKHISGTFYPDKKG